jgi:RPN1 N-terminal domain
VQGTTLDLEEGPAAVADEEQRSALQAIMSNVRVSERYLALARDLDVMAPRTPEEVSCQSAGAWQAVKDMQVSSSKHALPTLYKGIEDHVVHIHTGVQVTSCGDRRRQRPHTRQRPCQPGQHLRQRLCQCRLWPGAAHAEFTCCLMPAMQSRVSCLGLARRLFRGRRNCCSLVTMTHHFMQDKLMTVTPETESSSGDNVHWIFKNKDHGKTSATASLVCLVQGQRPAALPSIMTAPIALHQLHCLAV